MKKSILILSLVIGFLLVLNLFAAEEKEIVKVEMKTNYGVIELELYPDNAPVTVANFVKYAKDGFFDGLIFHRIISNFMIQGGGFDQEGNQVEPTYEPIRNEADNGLSNEIGTIAMARTNNPHSATSQFFINVNDNKFLNHTNKQQGWGYCVFGKVTKGLDIVNLIKAVPTSTNPKLGMQDWPVKPVIIEKITIIE
ncbi:MAG: peptidylprolyl isomerase [Candidatus Cloacimonadales bacterium]|nr:peptidylprolyl isomerase [Candidatus Cloacimonadales bacterium]